MCCHEDLRGSRRAVRVVQPSKEKRMGVLRIMSASKGDEAVSWGGTKLKDREDVEEKSVEQVRKQFDDLVAASWTIFEVQKTEAPKGVKNFDETAEEYIAVPMILGG